MRSHPCVLGIIRDWARKRGQDLPTCWEMSRPDERFSRFCADAHQEARHTPLEFRTLESYRALTTEIGEQFQLFSQAGYTFSVWRGDGQPYRDSREMRLLLQKCQLLLRMRLKLPVWIPIKL